MTVLVAHARQSFPSANKGITEYVHQLSLCHYISVVLILQATI